MHQSNNEIAGSPFLELKSDLTVSACEVDDLRFTFQILSQFPKRFFTQPNQIESKVFLISIWFQSHLFASEQWERSQRVDLDTAECNKRRQPRQASELHEQQFGQEPKQAVHRQHGA